MAANPTIPPGGIRIKFKRKRETSSIHSRDVENSFRGDEQENRELPGPPAPPALRRQAREDSPIPLSETGEPMEVYPGRGVQISGFPVTIKQKPGRPHASIRALVAADRAIYTAELLDERVKSSVPILENISHGQIQTLSTIPEGDLEVAASSSYGSSGGMIEVKGVLKRFKASGQNVEQLLVFPMHADWFSLKHVHRMERQVVPEYFSGKFVDRTPKVYMEIRNTIVREYMENPEKALSLTDCQGLCNIDAKDLTRIFEFLDHWGIINYCATNDLRNHGLSWAGTKETLQENTNGEIQVMPGSLRSNTSLIRFEMPRTKFRLDNGPLSPGCSNGAISDLDRRIQERLLEQRCSSCSRYCTDLFYQSQKETDVILCSDCFNDGKPAIGMATVDFVRTDASRDAGDADGNNWTDEETLLLLEALEIYNDNWNEIAEHVGTKSKAQCILHFIRLPMEEGLLDNIDVPDMSMKPNASDEVHETAKAFSLDVKCNGNSGGLSPAEFEAENRMVFQNSGNPVMSLVAFLASAVGPRVAGACARAALVSLSKDDNNTETIDDNTSSKEGYALSDRLTSENTLREDGKQELALSTLPHKDKELDESQTKVHASSGPSVLPPEKVKLAAMAGLSAAAVKAKLFADHEERDIQRLAANIVSHQLKRVEIKLKQFAEIETMLLKECEQVERARQRFSADRLRFMSSHFGSGGSSAVAAGAVSVVPAMNNRPAIPPTLPSASHSGFGPTTHPAMPFMTRPSMFPFGPGGVGSSVPLSAMQSFSGGSPGSIMMGSSASNSNVAHNMLRPVTGTNTTAN
ncbi:hypothetical protein SUGI_0372970 [Cryptomeria japonica]|uniref:SWI/SNF complex subunit SWI3C isoform X2 n=1 Tax=Cryptomeria japonica TaxID=3369 RepID=UPI002408C19F|nr:SWI/SNF complex subunit SWI3C isoform X2 [Cryptomeria japonica]GLJ20492.1 hypothetical protein SUGI_0372970 [Cryptomeria japonica]